MYEPELENPRKVSRTQDCAGFVAGRKCVMNGLAAVVWFPARPRASDVMRFSRDLDGTK